MTSRTDCDSLPTYNYGDIFMKMLISKLEKARKSAKSLKEKIYWERKRNEVMKAKRIYDEYYYQCYDWDLHQDFELPLYSE